MACTDDQRSPVVARGGVWRNLLCCSLTLAGIAICTWVSFRLGQGFAFTGFIYLVFVVLTAMYGGFRSATLVSVVSAACLNYFFVPPIFSFVNSPENWVALGAFEFTALVISQLSHREHRRTVEVEHLYEEMERLYQTSRRILLLDSSAEPGAVIASAIRETFRAQGRSAVRCVCRPRYFAAASVRPTRRPGLATHIFSAATHSTAQRGPGTAF